MRPMGKIKITKKLLEEYRKMMKRDIPLLEYELREMRMTERGLGNSVILNGKNGTKKPETVVGFDQERYDRREQALQNKKEKAQAVKKWIEDIEDVCVRNTFREYYTNGRNWEQVAMKVGYAGRADYVRLTFRDKFLREQKIL